ncbi:XylR N-terminal domain-containing protein [Bacillus sp. 1P10SD]|uniref:XylR N-terminal domain-containing protein n=1 Tax=Bacillus sp. 1P10SD TaxID=3132265 RepID=UPI0039A58235
MVISDKVKSLEENARILSSVTAFALLREELIKNIGIDRVKGFLLRYGFELGVKGAKNALSLGFTSLEEVLKQGPDFHSKYGHAKGVHYSIEVDLGQDDEVLSAYGQGTWEGSFEGLEHLNRFGKSDSPICYTLRGYVTGFMSTICGKTIIAKETSCIAMGHPVCRWSFKPLEEWGDEISEEYQYYSESTIIKDYKYTYQQLLEQRNYIYKVANLHKQLTEAVTNGCDLQIIADAAADITGIPIIIDDASFHTFVYSGMSEATFFEINEEKKQWLQQAEIFRSGNWKSPEKSSHSKKLVTFQQHHGLVEPIIVRKNILGYCTFVYPEKNTIDVENDYMLLERIANAASLLLLNEKTKFESFERMKGNFLEQLLHNQYPSRAEILKRGRFMNIDLGKKFYIGVLEVKTTKISIDHELGLHEKLLETTFSFFKEQNLTVLAVQKQGKIVLLITETTSKAIDIQRVAENLIDYMNRSFECIDLKIGISSKGEHIEKAFKYYEQALIAVRMVTKKKALLFESLGIVGILINQNNVSAVQMMGQQLLKDFYKNKDPKNLELLKTLYVFLYNGGKLEQTMKELSLSMSGLLYRIQKIEAVIGKDLRDPIDSHHILLVLEALAALGELEIRW